MFHVCASVHAKGCLAAMGSVANSAVQIGQRGSLQMWHRWLIRACRAWVGPEPGRSWSAPRPWACHASSGTVCGSRCSERSGDPKLRQPTPNCNSHLCALNKHISFIFIHISFVFIPSLIVHFVILNWHPILEPSWYASASPSRLQRSPFAEVAFGAAIYWTIRAAAALAGLERQF